MSELTVDKALQLGVEAHKKGNASEADRYYTAILSDFPENAPANHNMGLLAIHIGISEKAFSFLFKALKNDISNDTYLNSYLSAASKYPSPFKLLECQMLSIMIGVSEERLAKLSSSIGVVNPFFLDRILGEKFAPDNVNKIAAELAKIFEKIQEMDSVEQRGLIIDGINDYGLHPILLHAVKLLANAGMSKQLSLNTQVSLNNLFIKNKFKKCINACKIQLGKNYHCVFLYNLLASCYHKLENTKSSDFFYAVALSIDPQAKLVLNNLGRSYIERNNFRQARAVYIELVKLTSENVEFLNLLGHCHASLGYKEPAVACFARALEYSPSDEGVMENLLSQLPIPIGSLQGIPGLSVALCGILEDSNSVFNFYDTVGQSMTNVLSLPYFGGLVKAVEEGSPKFSRDQLMMLQSDRLLCALMKAFPIQSLEIEKVLICLRRSLLLLHVNEKDDLSLFADLINSISMQCWLNEFIYPVTEEEALLLKELIMRLERLGSISDYGGALSYLLAKSFGFLGSIELSIGISLSSLYYFDTLPGKLAEANIRLSSYYESASEVTAQVRNMYEENPYPRWSKLPKPSSRAIFGSLGDFFRVHGGNVVVGAPLTTSNPKILVAGTGTGRQALNLALVYPSASITAIDISRASLSYGKVFADKLEIDNVHFIHGDLLTIPEALGDFDHIECSGVIHHLEDPMQGWTALVSRLIEGGTMKIGLYSQIARDIGLNPIRALAKEAMGLSPTDDEIRKFRDDLKGSDSCGSFFRDWGDNYTTSEFRDLVFHVQEHQFTLPMIEECLKALSLELCCFTNFDGSLLAENSHKDLVSLDFENWKVLEGKDPLIFSSMYQFYCQKRSDRS